MTVGFVTVIVRVQPSSVPSDRADPAMDWIVIGPRPRSAVALAHCCPCPSLLALSGFCPWPLPCGLASGSADGDAPATSASGVSDWGRSLGHHDDGDREREADGDHAANSSPSMPPRARRTRRRVAGRLDRAPGSRDRPLVGRAGPRAGCCATLADDRLRWPCPTGWSRCARDTMTSPAPKPHGAFGSTKRHRATSGQRPVVGVAGVADQAAVAG